MLLVKSDGTLWSWGRNSWGELGLGLIDNVNVPTQIPDIGGFIDVVARDGFSLALKADGTVWAWGDDSFGRIGPFGNRASKPVQVSGLSRIVAIGVGWGYSSAYAIDADGLVWSWGENDYGQLGSGVEDALNHATPSAIPGLSNAIGISASATTTLAVQADGIVKAWGYNKDNHVGADGEPGYLGTGFKADVAPPLPVIGLEDVQEIAEVDINIDKGHFALKANGEVWSWGDPVVVDCGQGRDFSLLKTPTKINGIPAIRQISGGTQHVLFLTNSGTIAGCGTNSYGQLGDGTRDWTDRNHVGPARAGHLTNISWVAAGSVASAAIGLDGNVWTWGVTGYGISGTGIDGDPSNSNLLPVKLDFNAGSPTAFAEVFSGTQSSHLFDTDIDIGFAAAAAHIGKAGRIYIAALFPDGRLFLIDNTGALKLYQGGSLDYVFQGPLPRQFPFSFGRGDYSGAQDISLIIGYGVGGGDAAGDEMINSGRYAAVLTLQ